MSRTSSGKRPCRICGKWFRVDPREGDRQHVCSSRPCQRERHRRACCDWHRRNPGYDRGTRLRRRLHLCPPPPSTPPVDPFGASPLRKVNLEAARDAVGQEVIVVVEFAGQVLYRVRIRLGFANWYGDFGLRIRDLSLLHQLPGLSCWRRPSLGLLA